MMQPNDGPQSPTARAPGAIRLVDSHVHLDLIHRTHPGRIAWLKDHGCMVISWSFWPKIRRTSQLAAGLARQKETAHRLAAGGLACRYLAGIHPRNIPEDLTPERVGDLLTPFLEDPLCRGIGEIGLETGDDRETAFFRAQMALAPVVAAADRVFGVHTPRQGKRRLTGRTLSVLADSLSYADRIVVDHCRPDTVGRVLTAGFRAGVTLSPVKASVEDLERILAAHPSGAERIMANTDSGSDFHEDLIRAHEAAVLPDDLRERVFRNNAAAFFRIEPD